MNGRIALLLLAILLCASASAAPQRRDTSHPQKPASGPPDANVWVNTRSGVYHCPGTRWYGQTTRGEYMSEAVAERAGYRPASGKPCGASLTVPPKSPQAHQPAVTQCGFERWPVKVLVDKDRERVSRVPQDMTVGQLVSSVRPQAAYAYDRRVGPVETQTYRVRARLASVTFEQDSDLHIVISDPSDASLQMIAEVPAPECAIGSDHEEDYRRVRQAIQSIPLGSELELVGLGFFDREHGQAGSAANQIELHPILSV